MINTINSLGLHALLQENKVTLIDVRRPEEFRASHIKSAQATPLQDLCCDSIQDKQRVVVFYCHSGHRSGEACRKILKEDPSVTVYSLEGGIVAWQKSGFFVEGTKKRFFSLDRQMQCVLGTFLILSTMAGFFLSPFFYGVPLFLGAGLMLAGITGYCGMMILLAKMPWNREPCRENCPFSRK